MRRSIGGMVTIIIIIITISGCTALGGSWPPHANVANDPHPRHPFSSSSS